MGERARGWRRRDLEKKRIRAGLVVSIRVRQRIGRRRTLSELPIHLPSKNMEQVGRRSHVCNLHIAILVLAVELIRRWENPGVFVTQL